MRRRSLLLLLILSLAALSATIALGAASFFWEVAAARYSRAYDGDALHTLEASIWQGRIILARSTWERGGDQGTEYMLHSFAGGAVGNLDVDKTWMGFGWRSEETVLDMVDSNVISVPLWLVAGAMGALAFATGRALARRPRGCCAVCGYDLRATPHRCPECGAGALRE